MNATEPFKRRYRKRVIVEHRIARLVQLGIRQSRFLGRAKTAFQVAMAAAVANFSRALSKREEVPDFDRIGLIKRVLGEIRLVTRSQSKLRVVSAQDRGSSSCQILAA